MPDLPSIFPCAGSGSDRKSTRLNSSHSQISYAVFCLKKKKNKNEELYEQTAFRVSPSQPAPNPSPTLSPTPSLNQSPDVHPTRSHYAMPYHNYKHYTE